MKRVAILGAGMLGKYLYNRFKNLNKNLYEINLFSHNELDITNKDEISKIIIKYDYIINCAAYTNVDKAQGSDTELCLDVNGRCLEFIAQQCNINNTKLIHISTDFVYGFIKYKRFNEELYETEELNPINIYGMSKKIGEYNIKNNMENNYLILRVSWLFGPDGNNFITKIAEQLLNTEITELNVVNDQFGKPTSVYLIGDIVFEYLNDIIPDGLYNLQNSGELVSKFQLALFVKEQFDNKKKINAKATFEYDSPAQRQFNSNFSCKKLDTIRTNKRNTWNEDVLTMLNTLYPGSVKEKTFFKKCKMFFHNLIYKGN